MAYGRVVRALALTFWQQQCEASVIKAGRSLSFTEDEVHAETDGHKTVVMKASTTMALAPRRD